MWKTGKKFLAVLFLASLAGLGSAGCEEKKTEDWRPGRPLAKERVMIGVIHVFRVQEAVSGYAHAHEEGIREMQARLGLGDERIIRKFDVSNTDLAAAEHAMRECIIAGANVIIATTQNHIDLCEKLAAEFPNVVFAGLGAYKSRGPNFTTFFGRIYQPRYLSGIIAGLRTSTNKIGYVAAMGLDNSEVTSGLNAFALGVESVNPEAVIYVRTTRRWFDPLGEAMAAHRLLAAGCDVLAQHVNTATPQIEAARAGAFGIGYNSDMRVSAPSVVVSVVWNWGVYYTWLLKSLMDGSFSAQPPYVGDLRDGLVGLSPLNEPLVPAGAAEAVAAARKRIESGEFDVFEGEMKTAEGRIVGAPGKRLSYWEISENMDWYYHNVTELK